MFTEERIEHLEQVRDRILGLKVEYHTLYHEGLDLAAAEIDTMIEEAEKHGPSGVGPRYTEKNDNV
jgi:hypothetical protein